MPFQNAGELKKGCYEAVDNQKLAYGETAFPIIPVINGYAEDGEEIEIIPIIADYDNAKYNYNLFKEEIAELCSKKSITVKITEVSIPHNNYIDTELDLFKKLIDCTSDNDTLHCCITYGSKPTPIILTMVLNYAYRVKKNVSIGCITYGARDHNPDHNNRMEIYDITSFLYIDEMVRVLAEQKVKDPASIIKSLLKGDESYD